MKYSLCALSICILIGLSSTTTRPGSILDWLKSEKPHAIPALGRRLISSPQSPDVRHIPIKHDLESLLGISKGYQNLEGILKNAIIVISGKRIKPGETILVPIENDECKICLGITTSVLLQKRSAFIRKIIEIVMRWFGGHSEGKIVDFTFTYKVDPQEQELSLSTIIIDKQPEWLEKWEAFVAFCTNLGLSVRQTGKLDIEVAVQAPS